MHKPFCRALSLLYATLEAGNTNNRSCSGAENEEKVAFPNSLPLLRLSEPFNQWITLCSHRFMCGELPPTELQKLSPKCQTVLSYIVVHNVNLNDA